MLTKFLKLMDQYARKGDTLVVGVSGGADSIALLDLLMRASSCGGASCCGAACAPKWNLIIAHVDHGIRGAESTRDSNFVRGVATGLGLRVFVKKVALKKSMPNLEERAREIRRAFFEKLAREHGARWIVTAHHADDQVETMILNFMRGSGVTGLRGMQTAESLYLKPLLGFTKKELLEYVRSRRLKFMHDKTNEDTRFTRNFIRHEIIPKMEKCNPGLVSTLLRNRALLADTADFVRSEAGKFLKKSGCVDSPGRAARFARADFLKLHNAVRTEFLQILYKRATGAVKTLPFVRIEEIMSVIEKGHGKKRKPVGGGFEFWMDKGEFEFRKGAPHAFALRKRCGAHIEP